MDQAVKQTLADRAADCAIYNFDGCEFVECKHALWAEILAEIDNLKGANKKLRERLQTAYDAMKAAIRKCQIDLKADDFLNEHPEVAKKRLAIFGDLDIPLAQVGCVLRASDESLATIDKRVADALAQSADEQVTENTSTDLKSVQVPWNSK